MIQITGTLPTPMGVALSGASIRVTALDNAISLTGMVGETATDSNGLYDFNLVQGVHRIEVLHDDEYLFTGEVLVEDLTPTPLTLSELLTTYANPVV